MTDRVALTASIIARDKNIRKIVRNFQIRYAYNPPIKYKGSVLDGRDIGSVICKDAMFKFYITASIEERTRRRFRELKKLGKKVKYDEILKSMKKRDREDRLRRHSKLYRTNSSTLISTTNLSIKNSFLKVKKIMDRKLSKYGNNFKRR